MVTESIPLIAYIDDLFYDRCGPISCHNFCISRTMFGTKWHNIIRYLLGGTTEIDKQKHIDDVHATECTRASSIIITIEIKPKPHKYRYCNRQSIYSMQYFNYKVDALIYMTVTITY